ncbi:hypothetical protein HNP46_006121 [Pseudomonas nitritireducens]|uniref:Uncharacterized protein n=1 Tax=Pseudomonas nitroreducens TaxID=46680 RepID=A0A7W7KRG1_PSENT|nr:hypothetical protein [Pseudomonas nitritireducens]MBB4867210.1 hypothetical protein [Pseudomonas nitritireducens]
MTDEEYEVMKKRLEYLESQGVNIPKSDQFNRILSIAVHGAMADEPAGLLAGRRRNDEE